MVMLGKLKEKLGNEDMPMPEMEGGEGEVEMEMEMPEGKGIDLSSVSDEELQAELAKRGLV